MAATKRPGRPPRASKPSTERFEMRLTAGEISLLRKVADAAGESVSEWARRVLISRAADVATRRVRK